MDKQQREQQVKAFFEAAKTGDVAGLALALAAQVDVNEWDDDGCAAIHLAAAGGHEQAVQFLLGNGANLEARTNLGSTALNLAAASGSRRVVGVLIGAGARVDTPNNNYRNTPVHSAAVGGHHDVLVALLDAKAEVDPPNIDSRTPLHFAARSPSTEATKLLVERGADWSARDEKGWTPLWFAVERGRIETLQLLLSTQVSMDAPDRDGKTLLRIAVQSGEVAKAQLMLEAKAGVNVGYGSPLHYAVCSGGKMVSLLLQHRANIEGVASEGSTALHHAASSGFLDAVVSLVSARANVNAVQRDGHTPLHCAIRSGRFGGDNAALIMRVLLDAGADVDAAPAGKRTPLVDAVMAGLPAETEVLLSNGAAVDQGDERDQVPLHWAAFYGRGEVVRILLRAGASLESMGGYSSSGGQLVYGTPLEQALFYGSLMGDYGAAITLLECGASLDLVTRLSENARHFVHHTLAERRKRCWDVIIVLIGLKRFRRTVMQSNHLDVVMLIARRLIWPTRRHGIWDEQGVHCPTLLRPTSC